jgi:hypothetical protein
LEERKESSQTSTLERQSSKEDSTTPDEKNCKQDESKFVDKSSPAKIEEKPTLIDNDESTVRYIQVNVTQFDTIARLSKCFFYMEFLR